MEGGWSDLGCGEKEGAQYQQSLYIGLFAPLRFFIKLATPSNLSALKEAMYLA